MYPRESESGVAFGRRPQNKLYAEYRDIKETGGDTVKAPLTKLDFILLWLCSIGAGNGSSGEFGSFRRRLEPKMGHDKSP
ncbi:hypothetical protein GWI33_013924 [Rhynchophorus ferrugineus]|uniref:Uncharacterized protein n=1 Tax=Rhynchophorus ferrugineus TaxID=354439 RepID=A0A834IG40_RHYFE|nr:hypothetical protein GWI33_013924 [Rhynchophorus ferrugineus]